MSVNKIIFRYLYGSLKKGSFRRGGVRILLAGCLFACTFFVLLLQIFVLAQGEGGPKYESSGRRDPFMPLVTSDGRLVKLDSDTGESGISVEGIVFDQKGLSYALVNGKVVRVGDAVGDYQVLSIDNDRIVFIKEGQIYEVVIKKEEE